MITDEGEINAAASMMALAFSPKFDLRSTYFLISGIAGINPHCGTLGSVAFARYAIQVALQYEIDAREIPANFTTGYFPQGSERPDQYPQEIYGTEVFEVNEALRCRALTAASRAKLNDTKPAETYRAQYPSSLPAAKPPSVFAGDLATSDNFFAGLLLSQAFGNYSTLVSNGTAAYCMSEQEDNGTLEALLRADLAGKVDFSRVILSRAASDFDRPPPGKTAFENLQVLFGTVAVDNMYLAGVEVVHDIIENWTSVFENGIKAQNYIGDILDSLHGPVPPDFGCVYETVG